MGGTYKIRFRKDGAEHNVEAKNVFTCHKDDLATDPHNFVPVAKIPSNCYSCKPVSTVSEPTWGEKEDYWSKTDDRGKRRVSQAVWIALTMLSILSATLLCILIVQRCRRRVFDAGAAVGGLNNEFDIVDPWQPGNQRDPWPDEDDFEEEGQVEWR